MTIVSFKTFDLFFFVLQCLTQRKIMMIMTSMIFIINMKTWTNNETIAFSSADLQGWLANTNFHNLKSLLCTHTHAFFHS